MRAVAFKSGVCRSSLVSLAAVLPGLGLAATAAEAQTAAPAASAPAPAAEAGQLADIVVTAQKREQSLSKVGISVTAISGDQLMKSGIRDSNSIAFAVPNLENAPVFGPGTDTNFSVRGVAQNDYNDGTESPIATYLDEIYLVPTGAGSFPLFDMERVEVLRGPQGTLFGRNSTGGLIHFITAKPTDQFYASVSGALGSYDTREVTGVLNTPIVPGMIDLRIAGQYHNNSAWLNNLTGDQPDNGQLRTRSIRAQLRIRPSSNVTDLVKFSYDNAHGYSSGIFHQAIGIDSKTGDQFLLGPNDNFYGTGAQRDAFGLPNVNPGDTDNGQVRRLNGTDSYIASNILNADLGRVTPTSVTGYNNYHRNQVEDCDGTQLPICGTHYDTHSKQFSQELRAYANLGGVRATVGAYYLDHHITLHDIAPLLLNLPIAFAERVDAKQSSHSYALFANLEYDVTSTITLIGGARVSRDRKHFNELLQFVVPADPANPFPDYWNTAPLDVPHGPAVATNEFDDATAGDLTRIRKTTWSAKGEIDYKPNNLTLLYGSISRGVKSPGFNNGIIDIGLTPQQYQFKAETLTAYELGWKQQFWNHRASLNLSSFYYDYKNYDTLSFVGVASFIDNHDAKLYGVEGDFAIQPADGLTIKLNGGYVHSKLEDVANAGGISEDRRMPLAPSWSVGGSIRYELPVVHDKYKLGLQVDAHARNYFYNNPGNDSAAKVPSFGIANLRLDLTEIDDRYSLGLSINNLFDKKYIASLFVLQGLGGYRYGQIGQPRWVSADFTVKFR